MVITSICRAGDRLGVVAIVWLRVVEAWMEGSNMRSRAAALIATLLLAACTGGTGTSGHAPSQSANPISSARRAPSTTALTARLSLDARTVPAGRPFHGHLVLINNTGRPVPYCNGVANVGLAKPGLPFEPVERASGCVVDRSPTLPPGESHWPITLLTQFQSCTSGGDAAPTAPCCLAGPSGGVTMPPLPPGRYHTVVVWHFSRSVRPVIDQTQVQVVE